MKGKAGRNNLKHTELALCVDKQWDLQCFTVFIVLIAMIQKHELTIH